MEAINHRILEGLKSKPDFNLVEYGNIRKGEDWGAIDGNTIIWNYLVDLVFGRPVTYIIQFDIKKKIFTCFAQSPKTNYSSVFQFESSTFDELEYRLNELARHIPSIRERILREFLFMESKKGPKKKWYNPFVNEEKVMDYLESAIINLSQTTKISPKEIETLERYAKNLV